MFVLHVGVLQSISVPDMNTQPAPVCTLYLCGRFFNVLCVGIIARNDVFCVYLVLAFRPSLPQCVLLTLVYGLVFASIVRIKLGNENLKRVLFRCFHRLLAS